MDKEDVVHIHSGNYSAIKRNEIVSFAEMWMDGHTEYSQSEKEEKISYINAYMWNLKI